MQPYPPSVPVDSPAEREALIALCSDLRIDRARGQWNGAFGAEVCQVCGELYPWIGWAHGMLTHLGRRRECVCPSCRGDAIPGAFQDASALLDGKPDRFCELCRTHHPIERLHRVEHHWLCKPCENLFRKYTGPTGFARLLQNLVRVRYLGRGFRSRTTVHKFYAWLRETGDLVRPRLRALRFLSRDR